MSASASDGSEEGGICIFHCLVGRRRIERRIRLLEMKDSRFKKLTGPGQVNGGEGCSVGAGELLGQVTARGGVFFDRAHVAVDVASDSSSEGREGCG